MARFRVTIVMAAATATMTTSLGMAASPVTAHATDGQCSGFYSSFDSRGYWTNIPSIGYSSDLNCWLARGSASQAVIELQRALNDCYGAGLVTDGQYGPLTEAAVRAAQQRELIRADGVYGPQTRDALHWNYYNSNVDGPRCHRIQ